MLRGALPLFRIAGIQVYLHFSWFIVAWFEINSGKNRYQAPVWAAAEYIGLFAIVLLHEFGHAFACRSTGGRAERIVLWPLGGLAFVDPPLRPSAVLWSIAAGPLVNVALYPLLYFVAFATGRHGWMVVSPDLHRLIVSLWWTNLVLLLFNLLPFYPLDGGQIVRALLWFKLGPIRSLSVAAILGIFGAAAFGALAFYLQSIWTGIVAFFLFSQARAAIERAKVMKSEVNTAGNDPGAAQIRPEDSVPR
jgi:Zn-dependent protease